MIDTSLAIVSNRQPYRHEFSAKHGEQIAVDQPCGGLVAGLDTVAQRLGAKWIAWGDGEADSHVTDPSGCVGVPPSNPQYTLQRIWLDEADVSGYYEGYANRVLWPLCHCRTGPYTYKSHYWERYWDVNQQFANTVRRSVEPDAMVWFQDYHIALAPGMIRDAHDGKLIHFWHIPWPSSDIFRFCPQRREILQGLLANDVLGFHLSEYGDRFLECVQRFLPEAEVDRSTRQVQVNGHVTHIESFPLGVDVRSFQSMARQTRGVEDQLRKRYGIEGKIVLGVDRLDYTKGIPERLEAIERLLEGSPEWRGRFTYVQKCMGSREAIPEYRALQEDVRRTVDRINHRFGSPGWQPVVTIQEYLPEETLAGLYRSADVMLVTPVCDGMNLVAQEFVASQVDDPGALVLSEFAGVHEFFGRDAITINPINTEAHTEAILRGLSMNPGERQDRMHRLRREVDALDISDWPRTVLTKTRAIDRGVARGVRP